VGASPTGTRDDRSYLAKLFGHHTFTGTPCRLDRF